MHAFLLRGILRVPAQGIDICFAPSTVETLVLISFLPFTSRALAASMLRALVGSAAQFSPSEGRPPSSFQSVFARTAKDETAQKGSYNTICKR